MCIAIVYITLLTLIQNQDDFGFQFSYGKLK